MLRSRHVLLAVLLTLILSGACVAHAADVEPDNNEATATIHIVVERT